MMGIVGTTSFAVHLQTSRHVNNPSDDVQRTRVHVDFHVVDQFLSRQSVF
jgi:hypothetical protein